MRTPPHFDLERVVRSHGWYDLAPWRWDPGRRVVARPIRLAPGRVADVEVADAGGGSLALRVSARWRIGSGDAERVRASVRAFLALDEDLEGFRSRAVAVEGSDGPRPVQRALDRGLGRLLRSPTVFEDAVKTLCTTNCSWALTRLMVERLCATLGEEGPNGERAFPTPAAMAARPEAFYRETIRAGYRAPFLEALARAASGALDLEALRGSDLPTEELLRRLRALRGFGPYAAEHLLRLLGRHDHLALDSWTRAKLARLRGKRRPPSDRTLLRWYAPYGPHAGLAMWLEVTADWHGDRPAWP